MTIVGNEVTLSTGRKLHANKGLLSAGAHGDLYDGYDDRIYPPDEDDGGPLTMRERVEIARFMCNRWIEWAAAQDITID